ncbi:MAG: hypothetical protein NTU83_07210 [Candidatus Hydrogenedentes bacterium]|nr:hypothetical protein [Candidatus Hydrogenedentota bacterium]
MIKRNAMKIAVLFILAAAGTGAHALCIGDFNPFPTLPYEATTLRQDEILKTATSREGGTTEQGPLSACQQLADDATAPFPLRRWAALRRVELFCYVGQEGKAIQEAEDWLAKNPQDPDPLAIRAAEAEIYTERRSKSFSPSDQSVIAFFKTMFKIHTADATDWRCIEARVRYGHFLNDCAHRSSDNRSGLLLQSFTELQTAIQQIQSRVAKPGTSQEEKDSAAAYIENEIKPRMRPIVGPGPSAADIAAGRRSFEDILRSRNVDEATIQRFLSSVYDKREKH